MGRQPLQNIGLRTEDGWDISGEDVQIWLEAVSYTHLDVYKRQDLSLNPEITDELMVIYFDLNQEIFCITNES